MPGGHNPSDLRAEIDALIAQGTFDIAARRLAELWRRDPASGTASFVISRFDELREKTRDKLALTKFKLAILRSFTVEPIVPLLRAEAFAYGIDLEVHVGDFNTYVQDILDGQSSLYRFAPNAVVLAVRTDQAAPELWRDFADLAPEAAQQAAERVVRGYEAVDRRVSQAEPSRADRSFPRAPVVSKSRSSRQPIRRGPVRTHPADQSRTAAHRRGIPRRVQPRLRRAGGAPWQRALARRAQMADGAASHRRRLSSSDGARVDAFYRAAQRPHRQSSGRRSRQHALGRRHRRRRNGGH